MIGYVLIAATVIMAVAFVAVLWQHVVAQLLQVMVR